VNQIGFMQGRLSPQVDGRIQAFPWTHWRDEFPLASRLGFPLMEWTLDADRLYENPFMTADGRAEVRRLTDGCRVAVRSLTGDFLMQAPPFTGGTAERNLRLQTLRAVVAASAELNVGIVVWPLVDDGRLASDADADAVVGILRELAPLLRATGVRVAFESDFAPGALARFIDRFEADIAGINYDSGNSAALGFDSAEEWRAYGDRVINVHVKDRVRNGGTVPLGAGAADFRLLSAEMDRAGYRGDYILQVARAQDGDHGRALTRARDFVAGLLTP
jgi:hexulose-6-phosphate isomerase